MLTTQWTLLERLRGPADEQAWRRFVELYTPLLLRWAERQRLQHSDAADLVQDVMLLLAHKLPQVQLDQQLSFRAWLRVVFLNKWRERLRRRRLPTVQTPEHLELLPAPASAAEDREDRRLLLHRALELIRGEFSPITWQAFWESTIRERPVADVATELSISPGTVYAARSRVLARLRRDLDQLLD